MKPNGPLRDSFCAGFIAALLGGRNRAQALRFATATASRVAQGPATLGRPQAADQVGRKLRRGEVT